MASFRDQAKEARTWCASSAQFGRRLRLRRQPACHASFAPAQPESAPHRPAPCAFSPLCPPRSASLVCGGRRTNRTLRLRTAARFVFACRQPGRASLFGRFGASLFGMFGASLFGNLPHLPNFPNLPDLCSFARRSATGRFASRAPHPSALRRHPPWSEYLPSAAAPASRRLRRPCRSVGLWPRAAPPPPWRSDGTWNFQRFAGAKHCVPRRAVPAAPSGFPPPRLGVAVSRLWRSSASKLRITQRQLTVNEAERC